MDNKLDIIKNILEIPDSLKEKMYSEEIFTKEEINLILSQIVELDFEDLKKVLNTLDFEIFNKFFDIEILLDIFIDVCKEVDKFNPERFGKIIGELSEKDPETIGKLIEEMSIEYPDIIAESYFMLSDEILEEYLGIFGSIISGIFTSITSGISGSIIEEISKRNPTFISSRLNILTEYYPKQVGKLLKNIASVDRNFCYKHFKDIINIDKILIVNNIKFFWITYNKNINKIVKKNIKYDG